MDLLKFTQKMLWIGISCSLLLSCAAKKTLLTNRNLDEAKNLKEYCEGRNIQTNETQLGDSLLAAAYNSLKKGEDDKAYWHSDMASTYYKMGITKNELKKSKQKLSQLKNELVKDEEHLASLMEVYEEIKSLRR